MKIAKKIILAILALVEIVGGVIVFSYRSDISILLSAAAGKDKPPEEVQHQLDNNRREQKKNLEKEINGFHIRELTKDERDKLNKGKITDGQAVALMTGMEELRRGISKEDYDAKLAELIGKVYVLEARFSGAIAGLLDSAIAEYKALPKEMHTDSQKWEVGLKYLSIAGGLEGDCNSQMATLLSQIEEVLVDAGRSTELVEQIRSAYNNEKTLTKQYYLSLYA